MTLLVLLTHRCVQLRLVLTKLRRDDADPESFVTFDVRSHSSFCVVDLSRLLLPPAGGVSQRQACINTAIGAAF
eukprot:COSAG01_NODE_362_length_18130_cov_34.672307_13_plen_74_part_00